MPAGDFARGRLQCFMGYFTILWRDLSHARPGSLRVPLMTVGTDPKQKFVVRSQPAGIISHAFWPQGVALGMTDGLRDVIW